MQELLRTAAVRSNVSFQRSAFSDRYGRRPVLLFSLLGTAYDDLVMALLLRRTTEERPVEQAGEESPSGRNR